MLHITSYGNSNGTCNGTSNGASNTECNAEGNSDSKRSDKTRYIDLSIVNSNILIWFMANWGNSCNYSPHNISYNKYFYYLCTIKWYVEHGKKHHGNKVTPETWAKDGYYGRADEACPVTSQPLYSSGFGTCNMFTPYNKPPWKRFQTVSIGICTRVLYALQLDDDLLLLAKEDSLGHTLQDLSLKHRLRARPM